jgi:soluble lytic murein transglycosylase-like protein
MAALSEPPAAVAPSLGTPRVAAWAPLIAEASARFGVPRAWIAAVMAAESGGRTHLNGRPIVSSAGAIGLMQVMPSTYAELARRHGLGPDPALPRDNILAGTAYLSQLHERFGYPGLFAAYNAGPARYEAHLRRGLPLPGETRAYLASLSRTPPAPDMPPAVVSGSRLFFVLGGVATGPGAPPPGPLAPGASRSPEGR